jgi:hypothetical protein
MAKTNLALKTAAVTVISKTLSGSDCIASLQEEHGRVHTIYLSREESSKIDLGDKVKFTLEKVDSK